MENHNKELAVRLVKEKLSGSGITYSEISLRTGYERRQLARIAEAIESGRDDSSILVHGNSGRKPVTTASEKEVEFLRELKKPYRSITIAQFRDIFLEDVIRNPEKADLVEEYGLVPRSASWFRDLFLREHWESPSMRPSIDNGKARPHPIRPPMDRMGELVQIDGTPLDWLGNGQILCLHNAVDDATSKILSGYFMPAECTRGYCHVMMSMIEKYGIPRAIYSDKDTVFRSAKGGGQTQFAAMMADLGVRMVFANSPQAKGRVERNNETIQGRIVNDIIRFGIKDSDALVDWYRSFYIDYLNAKFSFPPADPEPAFRQVDEGLDLSRVFRGRFKRVMRENAFSYENEIYSAFSKDGDILCLQDGTTVSLYRDAFSDELYIERYGQRYTCVRMAARKRPFAEEAETQKRVDELLRGKGSYGKK